MLGFLLLAAMLPVILKRRDELSVSIRILRINRVVIVKVNTEFTETGPTASAINLVCKQM